MVVDYPIPNDAHVLVKADQKLDFDTPFLEKKINKETAINIAKELGINPKNIFRYLMKLVGESIGKGDTIALKKGIFFTKRAVSPYDGIIKEVDHNLGLLVVELVDKKKKQILSPFKGEVVKASKNQIEINLGKDQEFSLKKSSSDFGGKVIYLDRDSSNDLSADNAEDNIIFCEKISPFTQTKAEALGTKGFVTLQELPQPTDANFALLKNIDDVKKILKNEFLYCSIIAKSDKIYFYS